MSHSTKELSDVLSKSDLIYNSNQINKSIDTIAQRLNLRLKDTQPLLLCVMNGGLVFTAHLMMRLDCFPTVDYIHASRYRNKTIGTTLDWHAYPSNEIKNRTVVILDDILDEGITLKAIIDYCHAQGAKQVLSAVLVQKKHDRCIKGFTSDYVGLEVDDRYVFGFGMDYQSQFRHLNSIYALNE